MCCDLVLVHDRAFKDVSTDVFTNNIYTDAHASNNKMYVSMPGLIDIHFYTPINVLPTSLAHQININFFLACHTFAYVTYHDKSLYFTMMFHGSTRRTVEHRTHANGAWLSKLTE